ncbi:MAG TPA: glycosyltransferase [Thermoanaerobaculia bacterium]|nr:glycosyltransferase [Thermoanaerobaculia bacterium]
MTDAAPLRVTWQSRWGLPIGYAIHSEEIALQLLSRGVDLSYRPTPWPRDSIIENPVLDAISERPPYEDAPQISYEQADLFHTAHRALKIGWTMLEVDGIPRRWADFCNRMDEIWVPSRWGAERFAACGVTRPVRVMPLGYDPLRFRPDLPAPRASERFTFLSVFEWGERKAPETLLRAFSSAFTAKDDVLLLLRVNNFDGHVKVHDQIEELKLPKDGPPVALLYNHHIAAKQLGTLYRSADAFVLPTRGEGWGMPILEAMACGLPVIATAWSGPSEFFHEGVGYPVALKGFVAADAKCPHYAGFRWADPDADDLAAKMRRVYERRDEGKETGARAAAEAAAKWTWARTAERIIERLREIG